MGAVPWLLAFLVWVLAAWLRVRGTATAGVLSDQVGPWWVAAAGPPWLEPHAPPFGWGLYLPYWLILSTADSLWTAVQALLLVHAGVAPLALGAGWLNHRKGCGWVGALVAGMAAAVDPGLIDTALSGSKAYLAVLWIGAMTLGLCARERRWGPLLVLGAWAMAVMNHPLALCALPLLAVLPWRERRCLWALGLGLVLLLPRLVWVATHDLPNTGDLSGPVGDALVGWWVASPWAALLVLGGMISGLTRPSTRGLALGTLASFALLLGAGAALGYLRDYHLRILFLPALVGWAALPAWWAVVGGILLRIPAHPIEQSSHALRPGGLGLAHQLSKPLQQLDDSVLLIDGAWLSSSLAVEPAALTLDLWLRGRDVDGFGPSDQVVLIVSAERGQPGQPGDIDAALDAWETTPMVRGDRYFMAQGTVEQVRTWSRRICEERASEGRGTPRLGGAWDGLIVLQPELRSEELEAWWDCP